MSISAGPGEAAEHGGWYRLPSYDGYRAACSSALQCRDLGRMLHQMKDRLGAAPPAPSRHNSILAALLRRLAGQVSSPAIFACSLAANRALARHCGAPGPLQVTACRAGVRQCAAGAPRRTKAVHAAQCACPMAPTRRSVMPKTGRAAVRRAHPRGQWDAGQYLVRDDVRGGGVPAAGPGGELVTGDGPGRLGVLVIGQVRTWQAGRACMAGRAAPSRVCRRRCGLTAPVRVWAGSFRS